ncbi:MAG: copper chaperone CopZ [Rhodothermaceae bacterium]|nr:MAG: copper chaperone [Bacteroidota bacterium]GIV62400.1 MAG: copper chaperone CopZ [Rhodothermaceae bacterium]
MNKVIRIEGMSCGHCVRAVEEALKGIEGVEVKRVTIGEAEVDIDPERVDERRLAEAIEEEGYRVVS